MKMKLMIGVVLTILLLSTMTLALETNPETKLAENQGSAKFAVILFECESPEGFPDERYIGVLNDVNATLCGETRFIVTPLPWVFLGTVLETQDPVHVTMEFYGGLVDPTGQPTRISGFTKNLTWEW